MIPFTEMPIGAVVQIDPEQGKLFAGCFLLVTEVKSWGVQGFIAMPRSSEELPGRAYFRVKWDMIEPIGRAVWVPEDDLAKTDDSELPTSPETGD